MESIRKNRKSSQHGGILVEFALVMPVIIGIFTGFMDIGLMLDQRARLERSVYEAVRYGISVPGLEPVTVSSNSPNTSYPRQLELQQRLKDILVQNSIRATSTTITTTLIPTGTGNQRESILTVRIDAQVPAQLPGFKTYSLSLSQSAPYLFRF